MQIFSESFPITIGRLTWVMSFLLLLFYLIRYRIIPLHPEIRSIHNIIVFGGLLLLSIIVLYILWFYPIV
jgi:hypothetical protein